jgi:hypothetical protein
VNVVSQLPPVVGYVRRRQGGGSETARVDDFESSDDDAAAADDSDAHQINAADFDDVRYRAPAAKNAWNSHRIPE